MSFHRTPKQSDVVQYWSSLDSWIMYYYTPKGKAGGNSYPTKEAAISAYDAIQRNISNTPRLYFDLKP